MPRSTKASCNISGHNTLISYLAPARLACLN